MDGYLADHVAGCQSGGYYPLGRYFVKAIGRPKSALTAGTCPRPGGRWSPAALACHRVITGLREPGGGTVTGGLSQHRV